MKTLMIILANSAIYDKNAILAMNLAESTVFAIMHSKLFDSELKVIAS